VTDATRTKRQLHLFLEREGKGVQQRVWGRHPLLPAWAGEPRLSRVTVPEGDPIAFRLGSCCQPGWWRSGSSVTSAP